MSVPAPSTVALFMNFSLNHYWFQRKTDLEHKPLFVSVQIGRVPLFRCKHIVQVSWRKCCYLISPTLSECLIKTHDWLSPWWQNCIFLQVSPALEQYVPDLLCLLFCLCSSFSFIFSLTPISQGRSPASWKRSFQKFLPPKRFFYPHHWHQVLAHRRCFDWEVFPLL